MADQRLRSLFDACDADGDGAVSRADIETTLHKLAGKHQGSRALFAAADRNGNGVLEYDEFVDALTRAKGPTADDQAAASPYMEETGLRRFLAQMLQRVDSEKPQDPYLWMMQYLAKHRPKHAGGDAASGTGQAAPSAKGIECKDIWRVNTSAVVRRSPKKLLDAILRKACWEQVEDPRDERCQIFFVWDSASFLSRLRHPAARGGGELLAQLPKEAWINRVPGIGQLCDKVNMALALRMLQKLWPQKFRFWPKSWLLPAELEQLKEWMRSHKKETVIVKPSDGSLGEGIFLAQSSSDLDTKLLAKPQWGAGFSALAQRYVPRPLLLGGLKFDLRLYVVVLSTDPLEAYLCREGLARFCTAKYEPPTAANSNQHYMHLTNFSVNKKSAAFIKASDPFDPETSASKRSLSTLLRQIDAQQAAQGHLFEEQKLIRAFEEIAVVLLQAIAPVLNVTYARVAKEAACKPKAKAKAKAKANARRKNQPTDSDESEESESSDSDEQTGFEPQCFQVLGIDVLLDEELQPWLLEINGRPSMDIDEPVRLCDAPEGMRRCVCRDMDGEGHVHLESPVDKHVKGIAMEGALKLAVGAGAPDEYTKLDFSQHNGQEDLEGIMDTIARLYELAGGVQKAFTTYGARRALAGAIEAGLNQHDLDAAVNRWKHQGYRDLGDLEKDKAEIGVLDFASLLQEVAIQGGYAEDEEPVEALAALLDDCDPDP